MAFFGTPPLRARVGAEEPRVAVSAAPRVAVEGPSVEVAPSASDPPASSGSSSSGSTAFWVVGGVVVGGVILAASSSKRR